MGCLVSALNKRACVRASNACVRACVRMREHAHGGRVAKMRYLCVRGGQPASGPSGCREVGTFAGNATERASSKAAAVYAQRVCVCGLGADSVRVYLINT